MSDGRPEPDRRTSRARLEDVQLKIYISEQTRPEIEENKKNDFSAGRIHPGYLQGKYIKFFFSKKTQPYLKINFIIYKTACIL